MKDKFCFAAAASLALSGCGGGGSGSSPQVNAAPQFTSAASASVVENTSGSFYTATATDANGDALTYSIGGGADAAAFAITGDGKLSFKVAPNFEAPADSGADNVYNVDLSVSDGKSSTTLPLAVTVTNSKEGVSVKRIASNLDDLTTFAPIDGTRLLLLARRDGGIVRLDGATGQVTYLGNPFGSTGAYNVLAIAPDPDFASSGNIRILSGQDSSGLTVHPMQFVPIGGTPADAASGYWTSGQGLAPSSSIPATGIATPAQDTNNAGGFAFAGNGFIYAGFTDGSGDTAGNDAAQTMGTFTGKIVKMLADKDPYSGASVPPFVVGAVASGVHQPNGFSFYNGRLLFADRGSSSYDEIDALALASTDINFGWPYFEGTKEVKSGAPTGLTGPILQLEKGSGPKQVFHMVGGQPYNGVIPGITGDYVFADYNNIFTVPLTKLDSTGSTPLGPESVEVRSLDFAPDTGRLIGIVGICQDSTGVLYILAGSIGAGQVFRVDQGPS